MYSVFIRPILEYATEVWNNCSVTECDKIEKLQLHTASIVTGLIIFTSRDSLYLETSWEPLADRRNKKQLITFYKIHNKMAASYLNDITPELRSVTSTYETRNSQNYNIPMCNLQLYKKYFIPSVIDNWNSLDLESRMCNILINFKRSISREISNVPKYFLQGIRFLNIIQTRIRHNCSSLKSDLFRVNLCDNPCCECGLVEDVYHLLFICHKYTESRRTMIMSLLNIHNFDVINTHLLLWGDEVLSETINDHIFVITQSFIRDSKRFNLLF